MGRREVYDCDRCGAELIDRHLVWVATGTYPDPAEGTKRDRAA